MKKIEFYDKDVILAKTKIYNSVKTEFSIANKSVPPPHTHILHVIIKSSVFVVIFQICFKSFSNSKQF